MMERSRTMRLSKQLVNKSTTGRNNIDIYFRRQICLAVIKKWDDFFYLETETIEQLLLIKKVSKKEK